MNITSNIFIRFPDSISTAAIAVSLIALLTFAGLYAPVICIFCIATCKANNRADFNFCKKSAGIKVHNTFRKAIRKANRHFRRANNGFAAALDSKKNEKIAKTLSEILKKNIFVLALRKYK